MLQEYLARIHNNLLLEYTHIFYGSKQFFFFVFPLAIIMAFLVAIVFYLSKKNEEGTYEKEIKHLRKLLIKGKIDRKTFFYIRDYLKAEDLFLNESKRLDDEKTQQY